MDKTARTRTKRKFDIIMLIIILAVIGYSLNDTIIVYDRIRENIKKVDKGKEEKTINRSINEILSLE